MNKINIISIGLCVVVLILGIIVAIEQYPEISDGQKKLDNANEICKQEGSKGVQEYDFTNGTFIYECKPKLTRKIN